MRGAKVVQIIDVLGTGGAEQLLLLLTKHLLEQGADVTVVTLEESQDSPYAATLEAAGARIVVVSSTWSQRLLDVRRLVRLALFLRRGRFDIAHTHLYFGNTIGTLAAWAAGVPAIATMHSTESEPRRANQLKEHLEAVLLRAHSSFVVAVGDAVAIAHRNKTRTGRMIVAPNPVKVAPASMGLRERATARRELAGDPSRPIFLSVGRLSAEKGYFDLLSAFARTQKGHPRALLAIAGTGPLHDQLEEETAHLSLEGSVTWLGWRTDIARLLSASDAYVTASHWEGMPLATLEAMAAGLPVVATSVGDVPQLLAGGRGISVPPRDPDALAAAMASVLDDSEAARRMGYAARQYVKQNHDPAAFCDKITLLYGSLRA